MSYTIESLEKIGDDHRPFLAALLSGILQRLGSNWNLVYRVYRPGEDEVDLSDIGKRTVLVLWGDERSRHFPKEYFKAAGATIKCYCPESWEKQGIIPVTDIAMCWTGDGETRDIIPCSQRPHAVFFSGNLNYRRIDLFRGCCASSFGWPFRISVCYPENGKYPVCHKIEAVVMHRLVRGRCKERDFSSLFPSSFIRFNDSFASGLRSEQYLNWMRNSKIVWCAPGFMTNETCRLIEACCAGCVVMVGGLPDNDIYRGNPFVRIDDWRNIRQLTTELLRDDAKIDAIGAACREWYLSHFSPSAQAERIATAIQAHNY